MNRFFDYGLSIVVAVALFASGVLTVALGGCATSPTGSVDYPAIVRAACSTADDEIAFLKTQSLKPADSDNLSKAELVFGAACENPALATGDTAATLSTVAITLTSLYLASREGK